MFLPVSPWSIAKHSEREKGEGEREGEEERKRGKGERERGDEGEEGGGEVIIESVTKCFKQYNNCLEDSVGNTTQSLCYR